MREIKFRACLDTGEMVQVHGIQFVEHSPRPEPEIIDQHNDVHLLSEVTLMQYTGEVDKNGVDVYEGDILKCYLDLENLRDIEYAGLSKSEQETGIHIFAVHDIFHLVTYGLLVDSFEVIGNIHQHPELLNQD